MLWRCYGGVRRCYGGVMAVFGEIMAGPGCYGGVRRCYGGVRRCSARLWRDLDVMAVFGDVMAVFVFGDVRRDYGGTWILWRCSVMLWCYGGVRRCSARLWRDLDDALKDELYRIRGRGPPPDDPPSFNSRS